MKPRNIFKKEAFEVLQTKYPSLTPADIETADTELDNLYDEELTKEAKAIPEWSMFEDYSNGAQTIPEWSAVQEAPSALLKAGYQTAKTVVRDIPETALEFGQGMAGLGVDVASGLAQLPTGLVSPEAAKGIKKIGQGIKKEIGIESEQPEYTNDKEIKESQELQKQVEQYGKENPTWFSNFKKAIKEQPGSEELLSSAEGLKNFFQKSLENVADVASITATGKPVYNEQITEEMEKRPVKFWAETLLPVAGAGKMIKGKGKTITKETPETIPGYELKEGMPQEVPATEAISKYRQGSVEQLPPIKEIVGGEGEIAKDVIAEQQAQATDKAFKEQANTLAAKTEVRMLEEQMKENASRAARQAELEQGLGQTSIYDMLMQEAERRQQAKATEATLPEVGLSAEELAQTAPTLSIRDILQRGQTERGLKQPEIIDEQTGRIIKPTTTPEEMLANPLSTRQSTLAERAENLIPTEQELKQTPEIGDKIQWQTPKIKGISQTLTGEITDKIADNRWTVNIDGQEYDFNPKKNTDIKITQKFQPPELTETEKYNNQIKQENIQKQINEELKSKQQSELIQKYLEEKQNQLPESFIPEINVKEGFNKYLETLDTKNKAKVTNQIKPKINELQYLANNNERIEIIYDESGKENYRVSNGNLQTKINKTEYNILKEAGMKTIEPEQPLISKDWENMSMDELKQYPISELEKIVSDKRIQYNKRVDLNLKLQEIKQNQLQPQQQPLVEPEQANIPTIEQPAIGGAKNNIDNQPSLTNFIKSEEGFINPQKVFDFLFKNKKEPNPIETEPALKSYNEDMQKGYDLEVEGLQKRTQTAEALKPSWFTKMITEYVKKEYPITRLEAKAKKAGANIPPEKSPTLLASDFTYLPTTIQGYLYSVNPDALKVDSNTMGKIMQMKRIVSERKDIANRYTPVEAQQYLDYIKNNLPEEYTKYENAIQTFRKNRNEFVLPELERSRLFPKDLIDYIRDNENYSTNRVVKYLEEQRTGNRATGAVAKIFEQTGSTEQIGNPYKATILKDMALMTAARLNNYKLSSVDFLLQHFPNLIEKAKPKFIGWREKRIVGQPRKSTDKPITEYQKPKQSAFDTVFVKRDGKTEAYYTPKDIVDALNMESDIIPQWAQNLNSVNNMFKSAWIRYNYKFWLPAFAKDVTDTELFMPTGKGKATYTKELIPAIFKAIKSVYAVDAINDPAIREYYKSGIFIPEKRSAAYSNLSLEPFERQLESYDINLESNQPKSFLNKMTEPFKYVANKYAETGSVLERANKISAYEALKTVKINGKILSPEEVRHYARQLGSPAFLAGGKQTKTLQAILPFINPMVQGLDAAKSLAKLDPIGTAASFSALGALSAFGVAATMGYFGKEMQDQYKNITQTERDNFFSVPFTNIKVPLGFMFKPINKLINAFANDNENTFKDYLIASFSNTILQELPTFTPAFSVMQDASNILNGQRIYDDYRGFYAIPNADIEQAQNRETAINYMKYFWNNYGGGSFYKFGQEQQNYAPWQRFMRSPEEAERGEKQRVYKAAEPMKVKEARMRLASQHKARGEEYDTTENIIPGEIVKTKIQDALKKRKLSPEARARIMVIQERNPIIKKELINKFKKEGLW